MDNFWTRFWSSLQLNRAPVLDPGDIARKEQQDHINRLYPKNQ